MTGCFVAGTPVLLADGTTKPVEEVVVGDEVTAFNPDTGETEVLRVVDAFVHHAMPTYQVVIDDDQAVTTTAEHPFMVVGQGWTPVQDLRKGDLLVRPDGSTVTIHSVDATGDTATVHNFEVEGLHNYYVQAGNEWILVHNANCGVTINLDKQGKHIPGHRNFDPDRSPLTADPESLITQSGTGQPLNSIPVPQAGSRDRVDFRERIRGTLRPSDAGAVPNHERHNSLWQKQFGTHSIRETMMGGG